MGFCGIVFYSPDSFFVNAPDDGYMCLSSATLLGVGVHSLFFNIMFLLLDLMFSLFLFNCYPHFSSHSPHLRLPSELEDILVATRERISTTNLCPWETQIHFHSKTNFTEVMFYWVNSTISYHNQYHKVSSAILQSYAFLSLTSKETDIFFIPHWVRGTSQSPTEELWLIPWRNLEFFRGMLLSPL